MKTTAARAIADIVSGDELREDYIIPSVFNRDVAPAVAAAVADQARAAGTALAGQEVGFAQGDTMTGSASADGHTGHALRGAGSAQRTGLPTAEAGERKG